MTNEQRLRALFEKYIRQELGAQEKSELLVMLDKGEHITVWEQLIDEYYNEQPEVHRLPEDRSAAMLAYILNSKKNAIPVKRMATRWWFAAAAIVCGLIAGTVWWQSKQQIAVDTPQLAALEPGSDKAVLTLADGRRVSLDSMLKGDIAQNSEGAIVRASGGKLYYESGNDTRNNTVAYNTLTTPRGGQYQLVLPDKSHVWLNAASSLKYPTSFSGPTREVELTGEAYFEITPDKTKPFFVKTIKANVRVLGTGFNVNAYDDEAAVKTTLVHGSVQVSSKKGDIIIRPGEQAAVTDANTLPALSKPDMDEVLAWKEGDFIFKNANIRTIMRQLARWYDVEVVYEGTVPVVGFSGTLHRKESAAQLLDALALTKQVSFKIEGKKIIVTAGARG